MTLGGSDQVANEEVFLQGVSSFINQCTAGFFDIFR